MGYGEPGSGPDWAGWIRYHEVVPRFAEISAEGLCAVGGRHSADAALLLCRRTALGHRSASGHTQPDADGDAGPTGNRYPKPRAHAYALVNGHAGHYKHTKTGSERHIHPYAHAYPYLYTVGHEYTNQHAAPHPDEHSHHYGGADQYGCPNSYGCPYAHGGAN